MDIFEFRLKLLENLRFKRYWEQDTKSSITILELEVISRSITTRSTGIMPSKEPIKIIGNKISMPFPFTLCDYFQSQLILGLLVLNENDYTGR
jgi:hypothetical protein